MILRTARFADLDTVTLYALLRLRSDVFVVEQACPYPELDGRDDEPGTEHRWFEDDAGAPTAYLRTLAENDGATRIGRVVTTRDSARVCAWPAGSRTVAVIPIRASPLS